jgi:nucleoside-diphosphate-sugar epimerase
MVFGGAGFLGSHLARRFVQRGDEVVIVDGLMAETGGSLAHLADVAEHITICEASIDRIADLDSLVAGAAVVVDGMAWTRHNAAFDDPLYDLRLNLESHLHLLTCLRRRPPPLVIYLASRGQYGRVAEGVITEDTPMLPQDVQGVHKGAADHLFRIYAARYGLNVVSLRLPNCFGEHQPTTGDDIGLVGGFIRTLLRGGAVKVFGAGRWRGLLYAGDAAEIVSRLSDAAVTGFVPLNVAGNPVAIDDLARQLVALIGQGTVECEPLPRDIQLRDTGDANVADDRLRAIVGDIPTTALEPALLATIAYFRKEVQ